MRSEQGGWGFRSLALSFVFLTEVALIIYGASSHGHAVQREVMDLTGVTGIGLHILAFAVLTITALLIWQRSLKLFGALVLMGVGLEIAQLFLPDREAYASDAAASVTGVLIGWGVCVVAVLGRNVLRQKDIRSSS